jgi:arylsulfate sulfotransferase
VGPFIVRWRCKFVSLFVGHFSSGNAPQEATLKTFSINRNYLLMILGVALALAAPRPSFAVPTVQLSSSLPSPQVVGTLITWTATASDTDPGTLMYAFSFGPQGQTLPLVRDYGYGNSFPAYPALQEGTYQVSVTVRNNSTGKTGSTSQNFVSTPIATSAHPVVISPTANPLVALFSATGCTAPDGMLVAFKNAAGAQQMTPLKPCNGLSMNFYIAGMLASTPYSMTGILVNSGHRVGQTPTRTFTTGAIPSTVQIPTISILSPAPPSAVSEPILIHAYLFGAYVNTGTDLSGNVVWYYQPYDGKTGLMTRPVDGGYFWFIGSTNADPYLELLRELDVAGNTVVETNVGRINEQLTAAGQMPLTDVDHELRSTPNGNILMIGSLDKILGPNIQNGADIILNELVVLNPGLQVTWSWNAVTCGNCATELPPTRAAILGETCVPGGGGCPPLTPPNTIANDWLHGNSAQLAQDGSIVMSLRHQDWVLKIDYANGTGTGNILWRLGLDGDFTIIGDANDTYPWFSHQHDAEWEFNTSYMSLFDNGNTRIAQNPGENSRGQVLNIDQNTMTAHLVENLDTGVRSLALGTAQALIDQHGNVTGLHYEAGFVNFATSQTMSFYPAGTLSMTSSSTTYRTFQMHDMYSSYTQP